jgi:hypothetical protein
MIRPDHLCLATCLAHTVPGVTIELVFCNDEHVVVAHHRLDAHFSPCELRSALLADHQPGVPRFADLVTDASITSGLLHLGGGLYERRGDQGAERWFATLLDDVRLGDVFRSNPFDLPDHAVDVQLLPDPDLGATAVCVTCDDQNAGSLDEVASWALAACMVSELLADVHPTPINTRNRHR